MLDKVWCEIYEEYHLEYRARLLSLGLGCVLGECGCGSRLRMPTANRDPKASVGHPACQAVWLNASIRIEILPEEQG